MNSPSSEQAPAAPGKRRGRPPKSGAAAAAPRQEHTAMILPDSTVSAGARTPDNIQPGAPQGPKSAPADGNIPGAQSLAIVLPREQPRPTDEQADCPLEAGLVDRHLPGMDSCPRITPEKEAGGDEKREPAGEAAADPAIAETASRKDRFSLGDLESSLAMHMRARTAGAQRTPPAQRLARSGTFVWDIEKLGPPQRPKADRKPPGAFDASASPAVQSTTVQSNQGSPPPSTGAILMVPPLRRGPGRPRKNPIPALAAPAMKRPRGRPRKIAPDVTDAAPVKRKRGRPRKNPLPDPQEPPVRRKRGRPRKNPLPDPQEAPVRRRRGRPPKILTDMPGAVPVKRKRGRPRKAAPVDGQPPAPVDPA